MKRAWFIPITIGGLLALYSGWYLWQPGGTTPLLLLTHGLFAAFALLASILALKASQMFEPGVTSRRVWLFFGAGMTALAVSELLWLVYYFLGQPLPYPSVVDVSWGIGFIAVLASLVLQYRALDVQISRSRKLLVVTAYLGVLFVILGISLSQILSNPGEVAVMQPAGQCVLPHRRAGGGLPRHADPSVFWQGPGGTSLALYADQHPVVCGRRPGLFLRHVDQLVCHGQ